MNRRIGKFAILITAAALVAACGGTPAATAPAPSTDAPVSIDTPEIDAALKAIKRNGTYDEIRKRYFPFDMSGPA